MTPNEARLAVMLFIYKNLFATQCGKDCLLVKERSELYVILCVGRKISIHESEYTQKGKKSFCSWKFQCRLETLLFARNAK